MNLCQEIRDGDGAGCWWWREAITLSSTTPFGPSHTAATLHHIRRYGKKAEEKMKSEESSIKWRANSRAARVVITTGTVAAAALAMAAPFRWCFVIFNW